MGDRSPIDGSSRSGELLASGARTFVGVPGLAVVDALQAQVAFLGVPFDVGTPQPGNRTGQRAGPAAARRASWEQFEYEDGSGSEGWFDIIDAHTDFLDELDGARLTGASQLRRLDELPDVRSVTALGLRNVARVEADDMRAMGVRWATTRDLIERGQDVVRGLVPAGRALYVSVDLDVLDMPVVPGTTLPEPGGLTYRELRSVLAAVADRGRVAAFDIAELNPPYDASEATARLATWLITHFLCEIFDRRV